MWLTRSGRGVGGQRGVEPAAGVADEHVAGLQLSRDDRVAAIGQRRLLVDARAVPGQVDGDAVVAEPLQFGDRRAPSTSAA